MVKFRIAFPKVFSISINTLLFTHVAILLHFHRMPAGPHECLAILFAAEGDHSESLTIISLIFSMARDGARSLGQTSVQFMIERHRNSR